MVFYDSVQNPLDEQVPLKHKEGDIASLWHVLD